MLWCCNGWSAGMPPTWAFEVLWAAEVEEAQRQPCLGKAPFTRLRSPTQPWAS